jgi:hypothetical protein
MKSLLLSCIFLFTISLHGFSQSVICSAGGIDGNGELLVSWTLGEYVAGPMEGSDVYINTGFQQIWGEVTALPSTEKQDIHMKVFPNPATAIVTLKFNEAGTIQYDILISNINGEIVNQYPITFTNGESELNLEELPKGNYYISVLNNEDVLLKTLKIVKY